MKRIVTNSIIKIQLEGCCSGLQCGMFRIVLDGSEPDEIKKLAEDNERLIRWYLLLAWSLENFFRNGGGFLVPVWERHNRIDFNVYYHDQMDAMEEENCSNYRTYMYYLSNKFWEANK